MKCQQCGAELPANSKFCMECGASIPQVVICPQCNQELPLNAKFCFACGASLSGNKSSGIISGDANAISAHDIVNGNQEVVHGNKEIVSGDKITAETYNVNNFYNPKDLGADDVNVQKILTIAKDKFDVGDYVKANELFSLIADKDTEALNWLGYCYEFGKGVEINIDTAKHYYEKSAALGNPYGIFRLGCIYYGLGDNEKALEYFELAASKNQEDALSTLASIYTFEADETDWNKIYGFLKRKKESDFATELIWAILYGKGHVVKKDIDKMISHIYAAERLIDKNDTDFEADDSYLSTLVMAGDLALEADRAEYLSDVINFYNKALEYDYEPAKERIELLSKAETDYFSSRDNQAFEFSESGKCIDAYVGSGNGKVTIPDYVQIIGANAFEDERIESVEIMEGCTVIQAGAFCRCKYLQTITLPSTIKQIKDHAFFQCTSLESIVLPDSIIDIGEYAFSGCHALHTVKLPKSLKVLRSDVLSHTNVKSLDVPDGVLSIQHWALPNYLEEISLPSSINDIVGKYYDVKIVHVDRDFPASIIRDHFPHAEIIYNTKGTYGTRQNFCGSSNPASSNIAGIVESLKRASAAQTNKPTNIIPPSSDALSNNCPEFLGKAYKKVQNIQRGEESISDMLQKGIEKGIKGFMKFKR